MNGGLALAVFLACVVEAVEAATIVLAVGTTRSWRSAGLGVGAGLACLAVVVAVLGPAVARVPLGTLRLVVGGLLLVFGLQWLRKAVLRASGHKALHDEAAIYERAVTAAAATGAGARGLVDDWYSFTLAAKGVVLEGLEVAFITVTFGDNAHDVGVAAAAAGAAVVVVAAAAAALRAPLARVPENSMKLAVGVMLCAFGTFWSVEGVGAGWPGADAAIPALVAAYLAAAGLLVVALRRVAVAA